MIFKVIVIITMISGELNYAQESFEVKTLLPRLKRWQKGVNTHDPRQDFDNIRGYQVNFSVVNCKVGA